MAQQDKREAHPPTIAIHGDIFASAKICPPVAGRKNVLAAGTFAPAVVAGQ